MLTCYTFFAAVVDGAHEIVSKADTRRHLCVVTAMLRLALPFAILSLCLVRNKFFCGWWCRICVPAVQRVDARAFLNIMVQALNRIGGHRRWLQLCHMNLDIFTLCKIAHKPPSLKKFSRTASNHSVSQMNHVSHIRWSTERQLGNTLNSRFNYCATDVWLATSIVEVSLILGIWFTVIFFICVQPDEGLKKLRLQKPLLFPLVFVRLTANGVRPSVNRHPTEPAGDDGHV